MLSVSAHHTLYLEQSGNPRGQPVLFVHGGPGSAPGGEARRFFDPDHYRIIVFHQRGCGKSVPLACLEDNTTQHLVDDIEDIRRHLGLEQWLLFGGSWGSALSLAYAQTFPQRVAGLILRGIFTARKREIQWFCQGGAGAIYPDAWEDFAAPIPEEERHAMAGAYLKRLTDARPVVRANAAHAWRTWGARIGFISAGPTPKLTSNGADSLYANALLECYYSVNQAFFEPEDQLLRNADRIRHIPGIIVHGRYDVICALESAWALHKAWPEADLRIVQQGGHSALDPWIRHELIEATDRFKTA